MKEDLIIDGCAFTETEFTGVTEDVLHSKMDAFFLTIPGEGMGMLPAPGVLVRYTICWTTRNMAS